MDWVEFPSGEDRVKRGFRVRERDDMGDRDGTMLGEECGYGDICEEKEKQLGFSPRTTSDE